MNQKLRTIAVVGASALALGACPESQEGHLGGSQPPRGSQVLNIVSDARDPNGLPHNPRWHFQQAGAGGQLPLADPEWQCGGFPTGNAESRRRGDPRCTDQDTRVDLPTGWHKPVCGAEILNDGRWRKLRGHVNWKPATVSGYLTWNDKSGSYPFGDGDYTLTLEPTEDDLTTRLPGLTPYNKVKGYQTYAYHIEFNGSETVEHFGHEWWTTFRDRANDGAVHGGVNSQPGQIPDGTYAIVTGLFGLDAEHKGHSELHPVYALSLLASCAETPDAEGYFNDEWAVFVRNWGNEGFCADWKAYHMLDLPDSVYAFRIPLPGVDPASVTVGSKTRLFANLPRAGDTTAPGKGPFLVADAKSVEVRFQLPAFAGPMTRQNDPPRIHGMIHLRWKAAGGTSRSCPRRPPTAETGPPAAPVRAPGDGEDVMRILQEERRSRGLAVSGAEAARALVPTDTVEITDRTPIPAPAALSEIRDRVVRVPESAGGEQALAMDVDEPPPPEVCESARHTDLTGLDEQARRRMEELRKYCTRTTRAAPEPTPR